MHKILCEKKIGVKKVKILVWKNWCKIKKNIGVKKSKIFGVKKIGVKKYSLVKYVT